MGRPGRYDWAVNPMKSAMVAALIAACSVGGCISRPEGFDSADPAARLEAISRAASERDTSAVPDLVRLLRSDDPLVRFAASEALTGLTGENMGYRHEAPEWQREQAVKRWEAWLEVGKPAPRDPPASPTASSPRTPYDHQTGTMIASEPVASDSELTVRRASSTPEQSDR